MTRANLFPLLVNSDGKPTRHEFVGFRSTTTYHHPMYRCTETGEDRRWGWLDMGVDLRGLYGTERKYADDSV